MRRRSRTPEGVVWDGTVPLEFVEYRADQWPGVHPADQWQAWWQAGTEWAEANLPGGWPQLWEAQLDHYAAAGQRFPDQPWDDRVI